MRPHRRLPLELKIGWTLFLLVLVPAYLGAYGPWHFLWFSDLALFLVLGALWTESRLLGSLAALVALLPETCWILSVLLRLVAGVELGLTVYLFDPGLALHLRLLSLFHPVLPPLLLWLAGRLGYDPRALPLAVLLAWTVLLTVFLYTDPERNINFVFGFRDLLVGGDRLSHLAAVLLAAPLGIYLPTHLLLKRAFAARL